MKKWEDESSTSDKFSHTVHVIDHGHSPSHNPHSQFVGIPVVMSGGTVPVPRHPILAKRKLNVPRELYDVCAFTAKGCAEGQREEELRKRKKVM